MRGRGIRGRRDVRRGDTGTPGLGDAGTRGAETWGSETRKRWDSGCGTVGARGRDKQKLDFCAEL